MQIFMNECCSEEESPDVTGRLRNNTRIHTYGIMWMHKTFKRALKIIPDNTVFTADVCELR